MTYFDIADVPLGFNHVARFIVNANHKQSGLLTHSAATESASLCAPLKS